MSLLTLASRYLVASAMPCLALAMALPGAAAGAESLSATASSAAEAYDGGIRIQNPVVLYASHTQDNPLVVTFNMTIPAPQSETPYTVCYVTDP